MHGKRARRFGRVASPIAAVTVAAALAPASASAAWSAPFTITRGTEQAFLPVAALNARGDGVVVWFRERGNALELRAAFRRRGGPFGAPRTVGPASYGTGTGPPSVPSVAMSPSGMAIATWLRRDSAHNSRVVYAVAPPGGTFGRVRTISAAGQPAFEPDVAMDANGNATIAYVRYDGSVTRAIAFSRSADGRSTATRTLSSGTAQADAPSVDMTPAGGVAVAWSFGNTVDDAIQVRRAVPGGPFGRTETLSPTDQQGLQPAVAMGNGGEVTAAWQQSADGLAGQVRAAFAPAGARFGRSAGFSPRGNLAADLALDADEDGAATVLWAQAPASGIGPGNSIGVARIVRGRRASAQTIFRSANGVNRTSLAVAPGGRAAGVWIELPMTGATPIYGTTRSSATGPFTPGVRLTAAGRSGAFPTVVIDDAGRAIAVWDRAVGSSGSTGIEAALYTP